jgi:hypothetical protein
MAQKGWKSKGEIEPRRSPRKRGKTCGRPFKAPRPVSELLDSDRDVLLVTTDVDHDKDSQVEEITETKNERDLRSRRRSGALSETGSPVMVADEEVLDAISSDDSVIGSSFSGRLETGIGLYRLTTIPMPMRSSRHVLTHLVFAV